MMTRTDDSTTTNGRAPAPIVLNGAEFIRNPKTGVASWLESPSWISNGHWALRRAWTATDTHDDEDGRLFVAGAHVARLQRRYLKIIGADRPGVVLYATGPGAPFRNARRPEEAWFVLMPMKHGRRAGGHVDAGDAR